MSVIKFTSGLNVIDRFFITMRKSQKKATEMNDEELLCALFPKKMRTALKKVAAKSRKQRRK